MTTIAGREAEANVAAMLSPAKRKEWERKQRHLERKKLEAIARERADKLEGFYYERHYNRLREKRFNPKFNFPEIHGKPQEMASKGWKRTLQSRHQPLDDVTQMRSYRTAYKFRQRELGKNKSDGQNLKDGTMLAEASSLITTTRATVIGPLRKYRVVNISAGTHHTLVVTAQGKVLSMGEGRAGQLGLGNKIHHTAEPLMIKGQLKEMFVIQCAAGASHSLVRTRDEWGTDNQGNQVSRNSIFSWGDNSRRQLGLGEEITEANISRPQLVCHGLGNPSNVKQFEPNHVSCTHLSAGAHHSVALAEGGGLFVWGSNQYGQLGDGGRTKRCAIPKMNILLRKQWIVDATAGDMHTIVVTESGDLWTFGRGTEGQLGHGTLQNEVAPKWVRSSGEIYEHVTAGRFHTLCRMSNGTVRSFGRDTAGMLGTAGKPPVPNPGGMVEFGTLVERNIYGTNQNNRPLPSISSPTSPTSPTSPKSPKSPNIYAIKSIQNDSDELDIDQVGALLLGMSYSDKNSPKSSKKKRKSKKKKSPRNSLNKNGPDIISSPSNVYKLGPIVGMDRQNESASILHRAHNNGVGRNFSSEEDFVVQLSAGAQHSVAMTKRGLAYSFGFAGGNGRLGHGNYADQAIPKHITMLKDDSLDADEWTKRSLLEKLVDLEKHTNPEVLADSADPKDVDCARPANRVSDDMLATMEEMYEQQKAGNFAFEAMRAFRLVDKSGEGEVDWSKIRLALTTMRIPLRYILNPFSVCRVSVDELCETVDDEETGFVDETGFIDYLVQKHTARKKGMPRKSYSKAYKAYKSCRGQSKDLRPNPDGRNGLVNALEGNFIDNSLELGELVSREQCRKMFEYALELEFNEDGSKITKEAKARDQIPKDADFGSAKKEESKFKKRKVKKTKRGKKNWSKLKGAVQAGSAFSNLIEKEEEDSEEEEDEESHLPPEIQERNRLLEIQRNKKDPGKLTRKEIDALEALIAQPELLYGCLDLRNLGLTDKHVIALARALRSAPAISELDLRLNYISDKGLEALLETMEFHNELTKFDSSETLCGKCGEVLGFADPARQSSCCIDCGNVQWRPAFLLTKVTVKENEEHVTPSRMFKWFEVDYDAEACNVLARRLMEERDISLTRHEYAEIHDEVLEDFVDQFSEQAMEMVERMMPAKKARKDRTWHKIHRKERQRLELEVEELENALRKYGRRMFEGKHVPRYGLVSVTQILQDSAGIRTTLVNSIFEFFHAHVPMKNDRLLEGVQAAHDMACRSVDAIKWDCREMKVRILEILYALAGELYEHYLVLNGGATVCQVTSGNNCTYLLTREGTVVSMGSINNILDSFKEQIVKRLPDNFRGFIEQGRADKRKANTNGGGEGDDKNAALGKSPLMLPSKEWCAFDEVDMTLRFAPPAKAGEDGYIDEDNIQHESNVTSRYHSGLHHKDTEHNGMNVEDHDESVDDDERAFSDRESETSIGDEETEEKNEHDSILPLTLEDNAVDKEDQEETEEKKEKEEKEKEEKKEITDEGTEVVAQKFVGDHYFQGRRRPKTAMELTVDLRERADALVAEQLGIIEASLGQDKVKEYKRIADEMQDRKKLEEQQKANIMRHVMWNLDDILMADTRKKNAHVERERIRNMSQAEKRKARMATSRTGGFDPQNLNDLFLIYPGANQRFVQAMYEANGEFAGMDETVGILADLKDQGVFAVGYNPDEDEDVIAARKEKGLYSVSNFDSVVKQKLW
tara:strand:+ start:492 stop:5663 length:5172 start_codon:yes stop_codon:yes gene_type:complete